MKKKTIAIITGENSFLGSGHMQRMLNLQAYLNEQEGVQAQLVACNNVERDSSIQLHSVQPGVDLAIRDMRDSSVDEINNIRQHCPVLVIDDYGSGRPYADYAIDLLPHPEQKMPPLPGNFLYGYNFTQSVQKIRGDTITKTIDIAIYVGQEPDQFNTALIATLAEKYTVAALKGTGSYLLKDGMQQSLAGQPYAETILAAKVLLSHFGILLYEGHIAKCALLAIHPTAYHSRLADLAKAELGIINLGEKAAVSVTEAIDKISQSINAYPETTVSSSGIYSHIQDNLHNFYTFLGPLLEE